MSTADGQIVRARRGYFQRPLCLLLAANIFRVDAAGIGMARAVRRTTVQGLVFIPHLWLDCGLASEVLEELYEVGHLSGPGHPTSTDEASVRVNV